MYEPVLAKLMVVLSEVVLRQLLVLKFSDKGQLVTLRSSVGSYKCQHIDSGGLYNTHVHMYIAKSPYIVFAYVASELISSSAGCSLYNFPGTLACELSTVTGST